MNINRLGTLRQLEILDRVYTLGSVTAAAEELNLSQPTVSMQLKKLAEQSDVQLYNQLGKRLVFTEAGELFATAARKILREVTDLNVKISQLHGLTRGTLSLAVVTSAKYFIPHLLGPFCERYPEIDVQLKVGNREQVIERLKGGQDDVFVFSHVPDIRGLNAVEFLPNPLVPIIAKSHPLAAKKQVTLAELSQEKFLVREPGSGTRRAIDRYLKDRNIEFAVRMTIESNEAIKHAVMSNLGFSILSAHALSFGGDEGVARLHVDGFPIPSQWSFVWQQDIQPSPIAEVFLDYLMKEGRDTLIDLTRT